MDDPYVVTLDVEVCDFVWMDLFVWRIFAHVGSELLARLDPADRHVFESAKT